MLNQVTITGADDSIHPEQLIPLSEKFPFVEWGILLSKKSQGTPRYPSREWLRAIQTVSAEYDIQLAGHICGSWMRDLVIHGNPAVFREHPEFLDIFSRIQLNFSADSAGPNFLYCLGKNYSENHFIFQVGDSGVTEKEQLIRQGLDGGLDLSVLFDASGGKGELPRAWPEPWKGVCCGYAGGLGPDTLAWQLPNISAAAGRVDFWIDMESRVRSKGDELFDLDKVTACLKIAQAWMENASVLA